MGKEASVAPKERVNITYRPATGDAKEEIELPLKLLMLGDYTLQQDETPLEERKAINIDKDNFNDVMRSQNLKLNLVVPNKLAEEEGGEMAVSLELQNLKDFSPEAIARQVPELSALLDLREALTAVKGPLGNVPAFKKKIQAMMKDDSAKEKMLKELGIGEGESAESGD
jgi:type VI secretion system protein ImpB